VVVDGGVLRAWRRSRGWDVPEMAARLRKAAVGVVPEHDSMVNMAYRWERTHLRGERYALLYARALGVDPDDLAGGPESGGVQDAPEVVSSGQVPEGMADVNRALWWIALGAGAVRGDVWDVGDVERRELLRMLGVVGLAAPFAGHGEQVRRGVDSALNAPTTAADVAEWERVVHDYGMQSGLVAPGLLLPELLTDLDEAQVRLGAAQDGLRAPMARVCGYLGAFTAINLVNAGDAQGARRYWRTALRAIDQSGDRPSRALLYATRARFALAEPASSPALTLGYADEAIGIAGSVPCAGLASGHASRARALAILGDQRGSVAAVQGQSEVSDRLTREAAAPTPFYAVEQALHGTQSRVYAYAGRAADATRAQAAGLALVPPGSPIPVADFQLDTAIGLIRAGDPSEGASHVVTTNQTLPAGYRQSSLIRQNAARALELVPAGAAGMPAVAEARELLALPSGRGA
jgi:hypothetical protein